MCVLEISYYFQRATFINRMRKIELGAISSVQFSRSGVSDSLQPMSGPGFLFAGRFLITVSISVLVVGLLRFSISSWFSFGKLYFSKNLSISSKLSILLAHSC